MLSFQEYDLIKIDLDVRRKTMRRSTLANNTGIKEGYCFKHGNFIGSTTLSRRDPICPECSAEKRENEVKATRKHELEATLTALKENPDLLNELQLLLNVGEVLKIG